MRTRRQLGDADDCGFVSQADMNRFYAACKKADDEERMRDAQDFD